MKTFNLNGDEWDGTRDEDIMFARPGPTVEFWEGEDLLRAACLRRSDRAAIS